MPNKGIIVLVGISHLGLQLINLCKKEQINVKKELVMYSRSYGCPFVSLAKRILDDYGVAFREIYIDEDHEARERVLEWAGFLSVPTIIVTAEGSDLPLTPPAHLKVGTSPRGIDRGDMITEPNDVELLAWLQRHDFIESVETLE